METTVKRAKDLLKKRARLSVGDIVTMNDDNDIIDAYVVKEINGTSITICGIRVTDEKDDILIDEIEVRTNEII